MPLNGASTALPAAMPAACEPWPASSTAFGDSITLPPDSGARHGSVAGVPGVHIAS